MKARTTKVVLAAILVGVGLTAASCTPVSVAVRHVHISSDTATDGDSGTTGPEPRFVVPANAPGKWTVDFDATARPDKCQLNLNGQMVFDVISGGQEPGSLYSVVTDPLPGMAPNQVAQGSLTCWETGGSMIRNPFDFVVVSREFPDLDLLPSNARFANTTVGQSTGPLPMSIINRGRSPVDIQSVSAVSTSFDVGLGGEGSYVISSDQCTGTRLRPTNSCSLSVSFKPTAAAAIIGYVCVVTGGLTLELGTLLVGNGSEPPAPRLGLTPSSVAFGSLDIASFLSKAITLSNGGGADLRIDSVQVVDDNTASFAMTTSTCASTLSPGESCSVTVQFGPKTSGEKSATLRIVDNAAGSPHSVALSGTGARPAGEATPTPSPSYTVPSLP